MRHPFQVPTLLFAGSILAGCLWVPDECEGGSETLWWTQPGLYEALPPGTSGGNLTVKAVQLWPGLSIGTEPLPAPWAQARLLEVYRPVEFPGGGRGSFWLRPSMDLEFGRSGPVPEDALRGAVREFLENASAANASEREAMAEELLSRTFAGNDTSVLRLRGPLRLGALIASLPDLEPRREFDETVFLEGSGWLFTLELPAREAEGWIADTPGSLKVNVWDEVHFRRSTYTPAGRDVMESEAAAWLAAFGLEPQFQEPHYRFRGC